MADTSTRRAARDEVFAHCSFCAKNNTEVERLIAGAGVYICAGCVELCTSILDGLGDRDDDPPPRLPEWKGLDDEAMLRHVANIATTAGRVEDALRSWVGELRRRGITWARIGDTLGTTRQSAWERFAGEH